MKLTMINCILLILLLKYTNCSLVIYFQNFVQMLHLQVLLFIILPVSFVTFFHLYFLMIILAKTLFLVYQIKNPNFSKNFLVSYDVTSLFNNIPLEETIGIAINHIFDNNPNLNITRKNFKNLSFSLHRRLILFLTVSFIIKSMEQSWVLLSQLRSSWV